ncbi:MAG: hypothetical protein GKR77_02430 [Legionellales bacterium]|nr:hypothetical protein [Legionellales bacterium]
MGIIELTLFILAATLIIAFSDEIGSLVKKGNRTVFKHMYVKHSILVILASIAIISFRGPITDVVHYILLSYERLVTILIHATSTRSSVVLLVRIFTLLFFSFVPSLVLAGLYWLARQQAYPYFYLTLWITWTILVFSII